MSKRLQVLLDEAELRQIRRIARARRMTVAEWVRQALRAASRREPLGDTDKKLESVRAASRHSFPTGEIEQDVGRDRARVPRSGRRVILGDSTIPMYLVGAEHPHKADVRRLLERSIAMRERLVTDAEVLQEILHRYVAIDRPPSLLAQADRVIE
jgi:hypothetical protein